MINDIYKHSMENSIDLSDQCGILSADPCVCHYLQYLAKSGTPDPKEVCFPRNQVA